MEEIFNNKSVLYLTIKKRWFDMIKSGEKKEEYREIKPYWNIRLKNRIYDYIVFVNGYNKDSPRIIMECIDISIKTGNENCGAEPGKEYYVIKLGNRK